VAASLSLSTTTPTVNAGDLFLFTVTAVDAYGNPGATYTGEVTFSSSDAAANMPLNYTFVASDHGSHTFAMVFNTPGTQSVTATDTSDGTIAGTLTVIVL
jgi:hypothetical protein